jgi:hypothetical protein
MIDHVFFYLGLCFILTHELDAVRQREWAIFPGLSRLDDRRGYVVFTALHVPLYLLLFWEVTGTHGAGAYPNVITGLSSFMIVHLVLHILFTRHPENRFTGPFSWFLIAGAAVCGVADLLRHL